LFEHARQFAGRPDARPFRDDVPASRAAGRAGRAHLKAAPAWGQNRLGPSFQCAFALRSNARLATLFLITPSGAGPPLGHQAAPDRAVHRRGLFALCATCCHARPVWIGRNETRLLSLMSAPGLTNSVTHRNDLFKLGLIPGGIQRHAAPLGRSAGACHAAPSMAASSRP